MNQSLYELIQDSTVKLSLSGESSLGTGFFVGRNSILTCAHVVSGYEKKSISVKWKGCIWGSVLAVKITPEPIDLALLECEPISQEEHPPCVLLDPDFEPRHPLYIYGYPDDFPDGAGVTVQCEGNAGENGIRLIKFQAGQIRPGHSGSPVLNEKTGKVCGVVSETRGRSTCLGGIAISILEAMQNLPELKFKNKQFHEKEYRQKISKGLLYSQEKISAIKHNLFMSYQVSEKGFHMRHEDRRKDAKKNLEDISDVEQMLSKTFLDFLDYLDS